MVKRKLSNVNQLPLFKPEIAWKPTDSVNWPDFTRSEYLGFDIESYDPNLQKLGPGFIRKDAEVIGISLADEQGQKLYLPISHVEDNYDIKQVIPYLKKQLSTNSIKVGANLIYDIEGLDSIGIEVKGKLADIQVAEPLLNEDRIGGYTLEALSQHYLGYGKDEALLRQAAVDYGLDPKSQMKFLPARFVAPYATTDAENSVLVFLEQEQSLKADN